MMEAKGSKERVLARRRGAGEASRLTCMEVMKRRYVESGHLTGALTDGAPALEARESFA